MLERLLDLLRSGGVHRVSDLARELDTTSELVQVMLEDLARLGYLRKVVSQCGAHCDGCASQGLCAAGTGGQIWALTEKGQTR